MRDPDHLVAAAAVGSRCGDFGVGTPERGAQGNHAGVDGGHFDKFERARVARVQASTADKAGYAITVGITVGTEQCYLPGSG